MSEGGFTKDSNTGFLEFKWRPISLWSNSSNLKFPFPPKTEKKLGWDTLGPIVYDTPDYPWTCPPFGTALPLEIAPWFGTSQISFCPGSGHNFGNVCCFTNGTYGYILWVASWLSEEKKEKEKILMIILTKLQQRTWKYKVTVKQWQGIKSRLATIAQAVLVSLILVPHHPGMKGMRPKQTIVHNFMMRIILVLMKKIMMCWIWANGLL